MPDVTSCPKKSCIWKFAAALAGFVCVASSVGCGTTRDQRATQQLVMSDAVDRSVQHIDFRPLSNQKVYLDNSYLRHVKGEGFVNSEYVTSALRQQIVAAGCLIQDSPQDADIIVEARLGVLGSDDHRVTFGVPENSAISSAISLIPNGPKIPAIPEMAFARREAREAAAKIVAFAYHRESRKPIWQSGVKHSMATARDTWVLGIGPFQSGSIRDNTKLAGSRIKFGSRSSTGSSQEYFDRPDVDYTAEVRFKDGWPISDDGGMSPDMIGPADTPPGLQPPLPGPIAKPVRIAVSPGPTASSTTDAAKKNTTDGKTKQR